MLTVRLDSGVPLVDQLIRGLRAAIAAGEVAPGDELPPVRQLANDLGIHWNTVARAYRALESQGLVRSARGRGTRVTADQERRAETADERDGRVDDSVRGALADARLAGLDRPAIERLFRRVVDELWPDAAGTRSPRTASDAP